MITTVTNTVALTAALKAAQPGDTILLSSGIYSRLAIADVHFSTNVTIASETPGAPASILGLSITNSNGLTFRDVDFAADPAAASPFSVVQSQDVVFDHVHMHGSLDGDPGNDTSGLLIRLSTNVTVTNSEFDQLIAGITHVDSRNLTIFGNRFHDLRSDGVKGAGSSFVTISSNSFIDFFPSAADHADAIQFWTTGTTASVTDIVVTDNVFIRGKGAYVQGIFMRDEVVGLPYIRVTISGNLISGGLYNGIGLDGGVDVTIKDNVVQGYTDTKSWITVFNIQGAQIINNASNLLTIGSGVTNLVNANNSIIPQASDAGAAVIATWSASRGVPIPSSSYYAPGGSTNAQSIMGDDAANALSGGLGNDTVSGQLGADTISDPGGANYLRGDDGDDQITGGSGFDDINGNAGADTVRGGGGDDWAVGGKDNDRLYGESGNDIVYGNLGDDTCEGGSGNDILRGGQGNDIVKGAEGNDYVSGDKGDDTLSGGTGADTFHSFGDAGMDRISDFSRAQGDTVLLDFGTSYTVSQIGADTVIDMIGGGQMILVGVSMASLTGNWLVVG